MRLSKDKTRPLSQNKKTFPKRTKTETGLGSTQYEEYLQTEIPVQKVKVERQTMLKILCAISQNFSDLVNKFESFQQKKLLSSLHLQKVAEHFFFLHSKFFRFQNSSHLSSITHLKQLINASNILHSALLNSNENKKGVGLIFVKQEQEFCEFFKFLLGKQCQEFKRKYMRKILQEIWNFTLFYERDINRIIDTLNIWAHGISIPLNPARMRLHKAVITEDLEFIKKACQFRVKSPIYCHVNQADSNGITPLMLATYLRKDKVLSTLLLEYADPYLVPLTKMPNSKKMFQEIVQQIELMRGPLKIQTMPYCQAYNKNVIEYCRDNNLPLLTKLLALDNSRQFHSLKLNRNLIESIEKIPDCTFQVSWKKPAKLFGQSLADTIKVYKKRANLRFDFQTIGAFDKNSFKGKYSLIFKGKPDIEYYLVQYESKKITNLIKQLDIKFLQDLVVRIFKDTVPGKEKLTECLIEQNLKGVKGNYKKTILNMTFEKENIKKDSIVKQNFVPYEQSLSNSDLIEYSKLTHSEIHYLLEEYVPTSYPLPTRKKTQEKVKLQVTTIPFFQLNMDHLLAISTILEYYSPHFHKLTQALKWQNMLEDICSKGIYKQFPNKISVEMKGVSLTVQLENFNFNESIKNDVFELMSKLEEESFDCVLPRGTSFVRSQTQSLEESFASSVSKFFKNEDDRELGEAYSKYQNILDDLNDDDIIQYQQEPRDKQFSAFSKKNKPSQTVSRFRQ